MISHIRLSSVALTGGVGNRGQILERVITARGEISFKMFDLPESVIEIMIVLHTDSLVFSPDVLGAH